MGRQKRVSRLNMTEPTLQRDCDCALGEQALAGLRDKGLGGYITMIWRLLLPSSSSISFGHQVENLLVLKAAVA